MHFTRSRGEWGGAQNRGALERLDADPKVLLGVLDGEKLCTLPRPDRRAVLRASAVLCASAWKHVAQRSRPREQCRFLDSLRSLGMTGQRDAISSRASESAARWRLSSAP